MSIPIPSLNVSNLNIQHINLGDISFSKINLGDIIDVNYLQNFYILCWCFIVFMILQTMIML